MSGRFPLALLLAVLPVISCFPAPPPVSHQPHFLHHTFLHLRANRIRSTHSRILKEVVIPQNAFNPLSRAGLAFEPCSTDLPCQGERSCVQLADSELGSVEITDCEAGLCFCADQEGCATTADCLDGETCGPTGTCLSNAFVPGAIDISESDTSATLGLNLDRCESLADCRNPRNCVQFVDGLFGECQGTSCFCVLADPSCISISECSDGESCTKREGSSTAICISEAALENGDVTPEEITEITTNQPPLPPMPPKPTPAAPATEPPATEPPATEPPAAEPPATEPPSTEPPATEPPAAEPPVTQPPATEPATEVPATPATEGPATVPPATTAAETVTEATEPTMGEGDSTDEPISTDGEPTEEETVDREPPVIPVPEGEGESSSPTDEEDTDDLMSETEEADGDLIPDPDVVITPSPEGEIPSIAEGVDGEGEPTPSPEDEICIGVHHLSHMAYKDLIYSSHRVARVLCDKSSSCATPGHIVLYKGEAMMMRKYCTITRCVQKIMRVNSPRYSRAARVDSHTEDLSFTAFAARYESAAEEHLLRAFVRIGL
ncbi:Early nodulin-12A [Gracilariopsis chorda]|uniref:Early nodulin-12A n=1 Tax=Gracilariopsis chorda TaxID=448386 RepID=A0A2V3J1H7_9FLOR|nr:Early nodulin-12A [Gracilariopsis chorda]|eukprot:PXF48234.1 Early nodulin-12A [Gracilariopsis chorda]